MACRRLGCGCCIVFWLCILLCPQATYDVLIGGNVPNFVCFGRLLVMIADFGVYECVNAIIGPFLLRE